MHTHTQAVVCDQCHASLKISEDATVATCPYCETQLVIHHSGDTMYSTKLEHLVEDTQRLLQKVESLQDQNAVTQLDLAWEQERQTYLQRNTRTGEVSEPSVAASIVMGVGVVGFGVLWIAIAYSIARNSPFGFGARLFPLAGLLVMGLGLFSSIQLYGKAKKYQTARARYEQQRQTLQSNEKRSHK